MRLVVLSYRLTKIKGVLVSVGICALTNATMFIASVAGAAGIALSLSSAAQAQQTPTCNANNGGGTIVSTGSAQLWTAPANCIVKSGAAIETTNTDALTASGPLAHVSFTNYGLIHASLTGPALNGAYIAGLSNVTNVGSILNSGDSQIIGDYQSTITISGGSVLARPSFGTSLSGPGNTFTIEGVNNQSAGTIQSFSNYGLIQATVVSGMGPNTVAQGLLVGFNNDGSIGTLMNSAAISASQGGAYGTYNNFTVIGVANSNQIGTLTNSGSIDGNIGIYNTGSIGSLINNISGWVSGGSTGIRNEGSINSLTNSGLVTGGSTGIHNLGTINSLTNSGIVNGGNSGIDNTGSIGALTNIGTISGSDYTGIDNYYGTIDTLTNNGVISGGSTGINNHGTIGTLTNTGSVTGYSYDGIRNYGQITSLSNSGVISGAEIGIYNRNFLGTLVGTIVTLDNSAGATISGGWTGISNDGSIGSLSNSGLITGGTNGVYNSGTIDSLYNNGTITGTGGTVTTGIYNDGLITSLTNASDGTLVGTISGDSYGLLNNSTIGTFTNTTGAVLVSYNDTALMNNGTISTIVNDGLIQGQWDGVGNQGTIDSFSNGVNGTVATDLASAIYNGGHIGTLNNDGLLTSANGSAIYNDGSIDTVTNGATGTIISTRTGPFYEAAIYNAGVIGSLTNAGVITADAWGGEGINNWGGSIGTLANSGSISGGTYGVINTGGEGGPGIISVLTNSGSIGGGRAGIWNEGSIGSLSNVNTGTIGGNNTGIYNSDTGTITSLTNAGTIQGSSGLVNFGSIGVLTNSGAITGYSTDAIRNYGTIATLSNSGSIEGGAWGAGIDNIAGTLGGTIGTLVNTQTGTISGGSTGIYNSGQIGSLTNGGLIAGNREGVYNSGGTIGTLWNTSTGTITAEYAVDNYGSITTLLNDGKILGGNSGVYNDSDATIGSLINSGTITGGGTGVYNDGTIGSLSNTGLISGGASLGTLTGTIGDTYGVYNDGTINSVYNDGSISGGTVSGTFTSYGVANENEMSTLTNDVHGTISGDVAVINWWNIGTLDNAGAILGTYTGIYNDSESNISSLVNTGQITGGTTGILNRGTITSLVNEGLISGEYDGLTNSWSGSISTLTNSGTILATGSTGVGVWNAGAIDRLTNSGLISGASAGVSNYTGSIGAFANSGTILGTGTIGDGVNNSGSIVSLSNSGLIHGTRAGVYNASNVEPTVALNVNPSKMMVSTIDTLSNLHTGTISGGATGVFNAGHIGTIGNDGLITGAAGLSNTGGSVGSVENTGTITGTMSDAVYTDGSIGLLVNSGLIKGPNAINVAQSGSLGDVTNSGTIAGNIVNASANDLSIAGGAGEVFGTLTGYSGGLAAADVGQISNTASNVKFSAGNLLLNDNINVGTGTVTNAAMLQVNNALNITGNYQQSTAGMLSVGVAGMSNHGELKVSAAAAADAGGHVALTRLDGFRFAAGEQFTVIDAASAAYNAGSMTASAAGFSGGYLVSDVTTGGHSDLVVCLTNLVTADCNGKVAYSVANTSNAVSANNAAGRYFGSDVALNKLANAVVALGSTGEANRAGNQLLAAPHHDAAMLAQSPSLDILNVVSGHADSTRLADNGGQSGVSAGESGRGLATWGEGFGGGSHQSEDGQFSGYSMSTDGLVAGADAAVGETNTRVGGVFTYSHSDLKEHGDRTGDTMGLNSYGVLGYASFLGNRAYADVIGGVLLDKFDTVRVINFPGFAGVASGTHDGTQYVLKASGGYRFPMGTASSTTLTPVWGVGYSHLNQDGYTETGGNGAALTVSNDGSNSVKGEVGLKLEHSFPMASGDVVPEIKVLARHEFDNGAQLQTASFAADEAATTFSTQNVRPIENTGVLSTGVNLLGKDGVTVTLKYTAEVGSGYVSQGGSLRVRWAF